jgi:hypothetical protein
VVAGLPDQVFGTFKMSPRFGEVAAGDGAIGRSQMVVGNIQPHTEPVRNPEDSFEIVHSAASKQPERKEVELSSTVEEIDGLVKVVSRFGGAGRVGTPKRNVVETYVE